MILKKAFAAGLKDPESGHFQFTKVPKVLPSEGSLDYCALVNAKNSYGGYNGFAPFIGLISVKAGKIAGGGIGAINDSDPRYRNIVPDMCKEKGLDPYAVS
jgi:hypothetical protein